ncbi:MAG: hypothetical protein EOP68_18380 [Sphingomonas sp.]|jgi:hypothetical protein|nr:MAG: hypothetical protein EOP68_18380 [Sphingomonas sp.]
MLTTTAIAHLHRHQDALSVLIDQITALLAGDPEAARLPLAGVRWSIARKAREYQLFKHTEIFDPAIVRGRPAQAALAADLRRACLTVSGEYEAHIRRWAGRDTVIEWAAYRGDVVAMVSRLRRHLLVERQQVERLLAGSEQVRCLA